MDTPIVWDITYYPDIKTDPGSGVFMKHEQHQLTCTTWKQMKQWGTLQEIVKTVSLCSDS